MNKLFDGKTIRMCIDQYGNREWARTVKELKEKVGVSSARKMYADKKDGSTVHCGYVVSGHWFTVYARCEVVQ